LRCGDRREERAIMIPYSTTLAIDTPPSQASLPAVVVYLAGRGADRELRSGETWTPLDKAALALFNRPATLYALICIYITIVSFGSAHLATVNRDGSGVVFDPPV